MDESDNNAEPFSGDEIWSSHVPTALGKQPYKVDVDAQLERARRTIVLNTKQGLEETKPQRKPDNDSDSESDSGSDLDSHDFPTSHEVVLKTHERAVTTISLDQSGNRLVTGSLDGTIRLHDLAVMTPTTLRAFKTVDPYQGKPSANSEQFPICHVEFSPHAGGALLVVGDHPQPKILSRDGITLTEFAKGDMYLRDQHNTKGHTAAATTGAWHPTDQNFCVTAGTDSTLRIWDVNQKRSQRDVVVFKSKAPGNAGRTRMTAVAWASQAQGGNNVIISAALDGTLVMWSGNGPFTRPTAEIKDAHRPGTWTSNLDVSSDGRMVVTRGGDGLVKLWDMRNFKKALVTRELPSSSDQYPTSSIKYSPNSTYIITGSPAGDVCILNPGNLTNELVTPVSSGSPVIAVQWHSKLNQIIAGSGNAETRVLFSPEKSSRGALDIMRRAPKKRHFDDNAALTIDQTLGLSSDSILDPGNVKRKERKRADPRRPQAPLQTPFQRSQPDERHISENIPLSKMLHEDPREALLKYADVAQKDPKFTGAWQNTQPVTQYAHVSDDDDSEDEPQKKKPKR